MISPYSLSPSEIGAQDLQILIFTPTGRDAEGASLLFSQSKLAHCIIHNFAQLLASIDDRTGAILLAEEALTTETLHQLSDKLHQQPPWSDITVLILTFSTKGLRAASTISMHRFEDALGNVVFLERPLHSISLASAIRSAVKARRRQLQIRDYLAERETSAKALENSFSQFKTIAESLPQLVWTAHPDGRRFLL